VIYNKFIVYDNKILLGRVSLHKELLPKDFNIDLIDGGGYYGIDFESKTLKVYKKSYDFGRFTDNIVNLPIDGRFFKDFKVEIISDSDGFYYETF
jgi:hypothetical protein